MPYLDKYNGEWNIETAKQLLYRTVLGPSKRLINLSKEIGLDATIDSLFNITQLTPPLKHHQDGTLGIEDPDVKYGDTWINAPIIPNVADDSLQIRILSYRYNSLQSWTIQQLLNGQMTIQGKLWLFWHNHFVVAEIENPTRLYTYSNLIFEHLLGNFRNLTYKMTVDTAMLQYLSGATNTKNAPNENYARELLELFTLGKGDLAGPGDYTTFTEKDVSQGAKILTGWTVSDDNGTNPLQAIFKNDLHTEGSKQLSHRFDNITIPNTGEDEYKVYIDVIFNRLECAQFITRKFYKYFISPHIDEEIEENIIIPLASILYEDDYDVKRMLKTLLSSDYFYSSTKCLIKSPIELLASSSTGFQFNHKTEIDQLYIQYLAFNRLSVGLNQRIYFHPNVAGWPAYYQAPQFDKGWINTSILPKRKKYMKIVIAGGTYDYLNLEIKDDPIFNPIDIIDQYENAAFIEPLIQEIISYALIYSINEDQIAKIKFQVMQGLPDFEWTIEYNNYLDHPNDTKLKTSVNSKLVILLTSIFSLSEFQIA